MERSVPVTMGSPVFRSVDLEQLRVTEAVFPSGITLAMHRHERAIFAVMLQGGFSLGFPRRSYDCSAGMLFVEPVCERHENRLGRDGAAVVVLEIADASPFLGLSRSARLLDEPRCCAQSEVSVLAHRLRREVQRVGADGVLAVEALAAELLAAAGSQTERDGEAKGRRDWVVRVRDQLRASLDRTLRLDELAREAGVHRVHLGRVFRARYGESIGDYHRRVRIEWAAERLKRDDALISDVAARSGFADQAHFTRFFRRIMGRTPRAWIRENGRLPETGPASTP